MNYHGDYTFIKLKKDYLKDTLFVAEFKHYKEPLSIDIMNGYFEIKNQFEKKGDRLASIFETLNFLEHRAVKIELYMGQYGIGLVELV